MTRREDNPCVFAERVVKQDDPTLAGVWSTDKQLQALEDSADNLQKQVQQQRKMHEYMQNTLERRVSHLQQLMDDLGESKDSDKGEIKKVAPSVNQDTVTQKTLPMFCTFDFHIL